MTQHKPWAQPGDGPTFTDAEVEEVEARRVLTMVEISKLPTVADQLRALDIGDADGTVKPLTVDELRAVQAIGRWYAGACATHGLQPPPDILRAMIGCAMEVVSYNVALDQAGEPSAVPMPTEH